MRQQAVVVDRLVYRWAQRKKKKKNIFSYIFNRKMGGKGVENASKRLKMPRNPRRFALETVAASRVELHLLLFHALEELQAAAGERLLAHRGEQLAF